MENYLLVTKGFDSLLKSTVPYIARELIIEYGQDWWEIAVINKLFDDQKRNLPTTGDFNELTDSLDMALCLTLLDIHWGDVFRKKLPKDCRSWINELKGTRNKLAHRSTEDFNDSDTWRALDTMSRLCEQIDTEGAAEINELLRLARYGSAEGSVATNTNAAEPSQKQKKPAVETVAAGGLPSWREIMEPHQDVAEGRYRNAEFAADLAQVARGEGSLEYRDPVEFFGRTYITEGMKGLLVQSLRRISGLDGEPVIQLKTAFGGGKTHSMLALYHMLRNRKRLATIPSIQPILKEEQVETIPEDVHVAVIVGTALNPARSRRPANLPGITINTIWGEIAYQLASSKGEPAIYDFVKDADKRSVSPGSEDLAKMFDACGSCLVLMDELVAYAKKLYGQDKLVAGTLDNFITFIQELTEAARASKNSLVVASIPESDNEIGGEAGQRALEQIEHTFGRMEAIWKPVAASEGFEVVRRRLFLNCKNEQAREEVCNSFNRMYNENSTDFPVDSKELEYRDRMISCYPIHPEVFDRLYEDWATLESFQRTRGVLRLMASVIHELWMTQDASPMIMPGSFPLSVPQVRDELTRYLDDNWNGVVDSEIDGKKSVPYKNDQNNSRYGSLLASRRISRTIMLGSAPDVDGQSARGIEQAHIRLGVVQPGENIAIFNDALSTLRSGSSFLYSDGSDNRFWYDTRPTLRKVVEDRAQQRSESDALFEIEKRLKKLRKVQPLSGIHICPSTSLDVPDEQSVRMVILSPKQAHRSGSEDSAAVTTVAEILANRGTTPRQYKNMLVFVAADSSVIQPLQTEAKRYLAWQSIKDDREALNLDVAQTRETDQNISRCDTSLDIKLQEAYSWLLVPRIDLSSGSLNIEWEIERIAGSSQGVIEKAVSKLKSNESIIDNWAPALLHMELAQVLWKDKDDIQIKQLWNYLCTYCYLPRLSDYTVLEDTIRRGLGSVEYFAISAGIGENRYLDLSLGKVPAFINQSDFLIKPEIAKVQITKEEAEAHDAAEKKTALQRQDNNTESNEEWDIQEDPENGQITDNAEGSVSHQVVSLPGGNGPNDIPHSFRMSAKLDNTRVNRNVQTIMEEIVSQLSSLDGIDIEMSFEVRARAEDGIPVPAVRAVTENCNTLHIDDFGFHG